MFSVCLVYVVLVLCSKYHPVCTMYTVHLYKLYCMSVCSVYIVFDAIDVRGIPCYITVLFPRVCVIEVSSRVLTPHTLCVSC